MASRGLALSGAVVRFYFDGVPVGYATGANYSEEIAHEPIEPLGQFDVAEHVPTAYRVTFSAQKVRLQTNSIKKHEGIVIFPTLEEIITRGEATATIEMPSTGLVLANIERVKATRYSINIGNRSVIMTDVEFVAIRIRDESEIQ